jgi:hypothetical protein
LGGAVSKASKILEEEFFLFFYLFFYFFGFSGNALQASIVAAL